MEDLRPGLPEAADAHPTQEVEAIPVAAVAADADARSAALKLSLIAPL